jgi:hypothetical protein
MQYATLREVGRRITAAVMYKCIHIESEGPRKSSHGKEHALLQYIRNLIIVSLST